MPYRNIVFVKLEKRLMNDPRWYMMSEKSQLNYIRFMLFAAETYNKIPKNLAALRKAFKTDQDETEIEESIKEIKRSVPKLKENKHFYYFGGFEEKTNWINKKERRRNSQVVPKELVDKDKEKEEEKDKESAIPFDKFWELYDKKVDRKKCEPKWNRLSLTDQEKALAYIPGYLVAQPDKQFRKDPATFLNNYSWQNEIINKTPVLVPHTGRIIKDDDWRKPLREAKEKIKTQGKYGVKK